jgi:hypothetical protein
MYKLAGSLIVHPRLFPAVGPFAAKSGKALRTAVPRIAGSNQ